MTELCVRCEVREVWLFQCHLWKDYPFFTELSLQLCKNSLLTMCGWVAFWTLFWPIDPHVRSSPTPHSWNQVVQAVHSCSPAKLFRVISVFCHLIWVLGSPGSLFKKAYLHVDWGCTACEDAALMQHWLHGHGMSLFMQVFFHFSQQICSVRWSSLVHLLKIQVFYVFVSIVNGIVFKFHIPVVFCWYVKVHLFVIIRVNSWF